MGLICVNVQNEVKSLLQFLHKPKKSSTFALVFRGIGGIGRRARLRIWFREE